MNIEELKMLIIGFCFIFTVFSVLVSLYNNSDVFSPVKLYVFFNVFFYLDIYINEYSLNVIFTYLLQCMLLFIISFFEKNVKFPQKNCIGVNVLDRRCVIFIWTLSLASILNQIVAIIELGGVLNYIANIAYRVEYFKGKGYIIVLNNLIAIMNVLYLALLISSKDVTKKQWGGFIFHFLIFISIALLSGSRSFLLMTILVQVLLFHYIKKRFTIFKIVPILFSILFLIAFLGGIRNSMSTDDGTISVKGDSVKFESTHFSYGLNPLDIIYKSPERELSYGLTYASLITNFVPRSIYKDKLDSGGVVFTKRYTGDQWGGLSNLATGAVTEGVINFGYYLGLLFGIFFLLISYLLGLYLYTNLPKFLTSKSNYVYTTVYIYAVLALSRFSYSEFTYTIYSFVLFCIVPVTFIFILSKLRFDLKISRRLL